MHDMGECRAVRASVCARLQSVIVGVRERDNRRLGAHLETRHRAPSGFGPLGQNHSGPPAVARSYLQDVPRGRVPRRHEEHCGRRSARLVLACIRRGHLRQARGAVARVAVVNEPCLLRAVLRQDIRSGIDTQSHCAERSHWSVACCTRRGNLCSCGD